ncbi:MAG TPA: transcription-repair coupling factor [Terriglobales bacterium]|nr:transcription-repair coupling factor [Terriglobales bacterium]
MLLSFVREVFADAEKTVSFARLVSHLKTSFQKLEGGAGDGAGRVRVSGLTPPAKLLHFALLHRALGRPLLVLVPNNRAAEQMLPVLRAFCELTGVCEALGVVSLPAYDVLPFENLSPHPEIQETRASTLWKIVTGRASVVVTPIAAAAMCLREQEYYADLARIIRKGEAIDAERLVEHLNTVGYSAVDVVEMPGQYALRGGILDVYPPEAERPVRIEFFGDEVESMRAFDPGSQRSQSPRDEVVLLPLTETPVTEQTLAAIHTRLSGKRVSGSQEILEQAMASGGVSIFPGWEFYAPVAGQNSSIFDLLPRATVLVDEPASVNQEIETWWEKVQAAHERSNIGSLVRPQELYISPQGLNTQMEKLAGGSVEQLGVIQSEEETIEFSSQPTPRFHGSMPAVVEEARKLIAENRQIVFALPSLGEVERMAEILGEYNIAYRLGSRGQKSAGTYADEATQYFSEEEAGAVLLVKAFVPEGVQLPDAKLALFGALDLFDESEVIASHTEGRKSKVSAFLSDFRDLAIGDYVVHVEHGIGQYLGLKEISQGEGEAPLEFMVLEYADAAKLYVPLTRLDLVQKYRSAEGGKPVLNHLGSAAWGRTKARVKKAMADMADELLKLYAERKSAQGIAFSPDGQWQREFEDAFEYNETEDQLQATADIKHDMESSQPMDRLLCGDVGYGKTEVAMRAAFKAVGDNKQVAVLAPTTVLAFQHWETFKRRFAAFPLTIEMMSRFRSAKEQKEIQQKVEAGKVDILIGTHRLLSKDIKFADLGLVIVDEEQRFGVRHKEKLKHLKKEVDVLAMSATPIPRTLHMSLVGLRDMSVIETPPQDRMAIQTVVAAFDEKLIRTAIEHELERGGQIYFVHNRVESIYEIAARLQEMVPKARVLVGHGQMPENELEKVMLKFIRHEADVLVATTIIENGLDIPLCNTMIINRADRHGLSELYQLRGRVGRSNRRAYAYLLVPAEAELTPVARRRLAALKEFSDLGAGFKIAALDLELRGAGNLLGGQQSGHIDAVGFEMYTSMLEQAVREMKGEAAPQEVDTQLNLGLNIRIPAEYIAEENQRLRMYKRVAGVENEKALADVTAELSDRYGTPPPAVENLLRYAALRLQSKRIGVAGIDRKRDLVNIRFVAEAKIDPQRLADFVAKERGAQFSPAGILKFILKATQAEEVLEKLQSLLSNLAAEKLTVS